MCFSSQQPKPDINKPGYQPTDMDKHFKLTMGGRGVDGVKVLQRGDTKSSKSGDKGDGYTPTRDPYTLHN